MPPTTLPPSPPEPLFPDPDLVRLRIEWLQAELNASRRLLRLSLRRERELASLQVAQESEKCHA